MTKAIEFFHLFLTLFFLGMFNSACAMAAPLTFEGRYEFRTDDGSLDVLGKQVCFYPSAPTAVLVPRPPGDRRLPWFCFANSRKAATMIGFNLLRKTSSCGVAGEARVTVAHYRRYAGAGDGNDVATLTTVLSKSVPKPLPCE